MFATFEWHDNEISEKKVVHLFSTEDKSLLWRWNAFFLFNTLFYALNLFKENV